MASPTPLLNSFFIIIIAEFSGTSFPRNCLEGFQFIKVFSHCRTVNFNFFWRWPYNPSQID